MADAMKIMHPCEYITAALDVGLGRKYGPTGDDTTDCIRFQVAIHGAIRGVDALRPIWKALHLDGPDAATHPIDNIEVIEDQGWSVRVEEPVGFGVWQLQGWRSNGSGHNVGLFRRRSGYLAGQLMLVEASSRRVDWCWPTTWEQVQAEYRARLAVTQLLAA